MNGICNLEGGIGRRVGPGALPRRPHRNQSVITDTVLGVIWYGDEDHRSEAHPW